MKAIRFKSLFVLFVALSALVMAAPSANAQRRDYLTEDEVEIVRDAQQIDSRMKVLMRAIDRRFAVLGIDAGGNVPKEKSDAWGPAPTGTRMELLDDIRRIIQKAVDDIDNLSERPDSIVVEAPTKKEKPKKYEDVFPPAVRVLAAAARRYEPILKREYEASKDERERGLLSQSGDLCEEIIAAEGRLKSDPPKKSANR
ncbi:MAG: hypothetical protein ABI999_03990 [Acidobacteriota bacterium]